MRNLIKYPVTKKEILDHIDDLIEEETDFVEQHQECGGMGLAILNEIKKFIITHYDDKEQGDI